ncbi:antibiotic biosynthesis monooxygenase [Streptomyces oceani]|uniref:antibiotic biosynthesis monooxygenase n=1 Tax=Streptomyces oceani TaxID=1075402 RepID=UPI0026C005F2
MTAVVHTLPRPNRTDVGLAAFSRWHVGSPERQSATLEAIARAWRSRPWPTPDLRSYNLYASNDGRTLMHYSQWADERALRDFQRDQRDERLEEIFAAVPEAERLGLGLYTRYRGGAPESANDPARHAGCIVTVEVEFVDSDAERQRAWVDAVYTALDSDPKPHPGGI